MIKSSPLIIAHRGGKFWEDADFSYIKKSIQDGADIIELDIRMKDGKYIVQHTPLEKIQGSLEDALKLVENTKIYLDIKNKIDVNNLIPHVRSICSNEIIIGSYDTKLLASIQDKTVIRNCHCVSPWTAISKGKSCEANWINPICYTATKSLSKEIQSEGFKFVPSGNQIFKKNEIMTNLKKYTLWGAYAISTHHVKEMRKMLDTNITFL
jgi:hypothetical protein